MKSFEDFTLCNVASNRFNWFLMQSTRLEECGSRSLAVRSPWSSGRPSKTRKTTLWARLWTVCAGGPSVCLLVCRGGSFLGVIIAGMRAIKLSLFYYIYKSINLYVYIDLLIYYYVLIYDIERTLLHLQELQETDFLSKLDMKNSQDTSEDLCTRAPPRDSWRLRSQKRGRAPLRASKTLVSQTQNGGTNSSAKMKM